MERNLGEEAVAKLIKDHDLKNRDLVLASTESITYKMVNRAIKGRRLTPNVRTRSRGRKGIA